MNPTVSQFDLLNKSPAALEQLAGVRVDAADVHARITWLVDVAKATQEEFANVLVHREPLPATFHATLAAVLAEEPPSPGQKRAATGRYLEQWMRLELIACMRKLFDCFAELPALCAQHRIALSRSANGGFHFKFPHQDKFVDCMMEGMVCQLLAEHGLTRAPSVHYTAEVPPSARAAVVELLGAEVRKRAK